MTLCDSKTIRWRTLLNMLMIRLFLLNAGNFLSKSKTVSFTRRIVFLHVGIQLDCFGRNTTFCEHSNVMPD
jgi:hypothetical protein